MHRGLDVFKVLFTFIFLRKAFVFQTWILIEVSHYKTDSNITLVKI